MIENVVQIKSWITIYIVKIKKNKHVCEKGHIWNSCTCTYENGKHLESLIGDSVITFDETKKTTKNVPTKTVPIKTNISKTFSTNFSEKRYPVK